MQIQYEPIGRLKTGFSELAPVIRVMAFTCSKARPFMLRACALQMLAQTYPIDHYIYMNSESADAANTDTNYLDLIQDVPVSEYRRVYAAYGPTGSFHDNHMAILKNIDLDQYDLFLKVDDDDIYFSDYVETVVKDYQQNRWDFSGSFSDGVLNFSHWLKQLKNRDLGLTQEDQRLGVIGMMPSTYAFTRKALDIILAQNTHEFYEDVQWRRTFAQQKDFKIHFRQNSRYVYHVHGTNVSKVSLA